MAVKKTATTKRPVAAKTSTAKSIEAKVLEFGTKVSGLDANINAAYDKMLELKAFAEKANSDLTLGIMVKEAEADVAAERKKADIEKELADAKEKATAEFAKLEELFEAGDKELKSKLDKLNDAVADKARQNSRDLEDLEFELKTKKRENKLATAAFIANSYGQELVEKGTAQAAEDKLTQMKEEIEAKIEAAEKSAKSKVYMEKGSEISKINGEKRELEIMLKAALERAERAETSLSRAESRLELVPKQLAEAVAAGKTDVSMHNDNAKR